MSDDDKKGSSDKSTGDFLGIGKATKGLTDLLGKIIDKVPKLTNPSKKLVSCLIFFLADMIFILLSMIIGAWLKLEFPTAWDIRVIFAIGIVTLLWAIGGEDKKSKAVAEETTPKVTKRTPKKPNKEQSAEG